jgi:hypothetical protein
MVLLLTGHDVISIQDLFATLLSARSDKGDELQGAAVDCNSAGVTHAWFDSRVAHH